MKVSTRTVVCLLAASVPQSILAQSDVQSSPACNEIKRAFDEMSALTPPFAPNNASSGTTGTVYTLDGIGSCKPRVRSLKNPKRLAQNLFCQIGEKSIAPNDLATGDSMFAVALRIVESCGEPLGLVRLGNRSKNKDNGKPINELKYRKLNVDQSVASRWLRAQRRPHRSQLVLSNYHDLDSPAYERRLQAASSKARQSVPVIIKKVTPSSAQTNQPRQSYATPPPPPPCNSGPYFVFFDWNSAEIDQANEEKVRKAVMGYANCGTASVMLSGHADRSQGVRESVELSERRNVAVMNALTGKGIPGSKISSAALGSSQMRKATPNGIREKENRRVEIRFGPSGAAARKPSGSDRSNRAAPVASPSTIPPDFGGEITYSGSYGGEVTKGGSRIRGMDIALGVRAGVSRKTFPLRGDYTITIIFDGNRIRGTVSPRSTIGGSGGTLARTSFTGTRNGKSCNINWSVGGGVRGAFCSKNVFSFNLKDYRTPKGDSYTYNVRATKLRIVDYAERDKLARSVAANTRSHSGARSPQRCGGQRVTRALTVARSSANSDHSNKTVQGSPQSPSERRLDAEAIHNEIRPESEFFESVKLAFSCTNQAPQKTLRRNLDTILPDLKSLDAKELRSVKDWVQKAAESRMDNATSKKGKGGKTSSISLVRIFTSDGLKIIDPYDYFVLSAWAVADENADWEKRFGIPRASEAAKKGKDIAGRSLATLEWFRNEFGEAPVIYDRSSVLGLLAATEGYLESKGRR